MPFKITSGIYSKPQVIFLHDCLDILADHTFFTLTSLSLDSYHRPLPYRAYQLEQRFRQWVRLAIDQQRFAAVDGGLHALAIVGNLDQHLLLQALRHLLGADRVTLFHLAQDQAHALTRDPQLRQGIEEGACVLDRRDVG